MTDQPNTSFQYCLISVFPQVWPYDSKGQLPLGGVRKMVTISFLCVAAALLSSCIQAEDPEVHMNAVSFEFKTKPTLSARYHTVAWDMRLRFQTISNH